MEAVCCKETLTNIAVKAIVISDVQVWKRAVNMRAYFLSSLGGSEDPDDRNARSLSWSCTRLTQRQRRVELGRYCLIVVDAIQT